MENNNEKKQLFLSECHQFHTVWNWWYGMGKVTIPFPTVEEDKFWQ